MTPDWQPIKVCVLDVEDLPESISSAHYGMVWALVREATRPRGMIRLPLGGSGITREELLRAIAALPPVVGAAPLRVATERLPSISVVIPTTLQRTSLLDACLGSLAALEYPDYEVIVVDNRPEGAPAVRLPGARVVREPRPGASAARNRGLREAAGEIVAYTDDDVEVDAAWLLAIGSRLLRHPEEVGVTGMVLPRELETAPQVAIEDYYGSLGPRTFVPVSHRLRSRSAGRRWMHPATVEAIDDAGNCRQSFSLYATGTLGTGGNMAFRREPLRAIGGFDVSLGPGTPARSGEELSLMARLVWQGESLGFEPAAIVHHNNYADEETVRAQIEGYGIGYGALITALVAEDPRHLGCVLATLPRAVRLMAGQYRRKLDTRQPSPRNRDLAKLELRGIMRGLPAYLRSREQTR